MVQIARLPRSSPIPSAGGFDGRGTGPDEAGVSPFSERLGDECLTGSMASAGGTGHHPF